MKEQLQIIAMDLLGTYLKQVPKTLQASFDALEDAEISTDTFSFYTSVSSVFSCKIEGEDIELDSYIKHKKFGIEFLPDYTKKLTTYTMLILLQKTMNSIKRIFLKHINY